MSNKEKETYHTAGLGKKKSLIGLCWCTFLPVFHTNYLCKKSFIVCSLFCLKKISQVNPVKMHSNKSSNQLRPEMDLPSQHEAGGK